MKTLTKCGRQIICKVLNIGSENSIFVTNEEAFLDRINLLRIYKNTDAVIEVYKRELEKYTNEYAYLNAIIEAENKLYNYLESMIESNLKQSDSKSKSLDDIVYQSLETPASSNLKTEFIDKPMLRIYFDRPVFNIMRFIFKDSNIIDGIYDSFEEFVVSLGEVEILKYIKDLDLNKFKPAIRTYILNQILELNCIIINDLVPKYINGKHLVYVNKDGVIFESSPNKNIKSIESIKDVLVRYKESHMLDANIELYKYITVDDKEDLRIKYNLLLNEVNTYDLDDMSEVDKIRYLRHIYREEFSKYDNFIKIDNYDMQIVTGL